MAEVFIAEKGQLTNASKRDLRKAGIVVVEVEDRTRCDFVRSSEVVSADDMLWAAVHAVNVKDGYNSGVAQRGQLAKNLLKVIEDARGKRQPTVPSDEGGED